MITLAWLLSCFRHKVKCRIEFFDYHCRSTATDERLRTDADGYHRFGLPKRGYVDAEMLENIYAQVVNDEPDLAAALSNASAKWPAEIGEDVARSRAHEWYLFSECRAYFDWFPAGLAGPPPRARAPSTPPDLVRAGYAFAAAGGERAPELDGAVTHVVVSRADLCRYAAIQARLQALGTAESVAVVCAEWVGASVAAGAVAASEGFEVGAEDLPDEGL